RDHESRRDRRPQWNRRGRPRDRTAAGVAGRRPGSARRHRGGDAGATGHAPRRGRGMSDHTTDQAGRLRARVAGRRARIVTVTSGKGGVGKTTLVANLGLELARLGRSVLLFDGDLGLANLAILFNQAPKRTLEDALAGRCSLEDVVLTINERLALLPAATGASRLADLDDHDRVALLSDLARL